MNRRRSNRLFLLFGSLGFLVLIPLVPLVLWSFSAGWRWPDVVPGQWGIRPWVYVFSAHAQTGEAAFNSLWIAVVVTVINGCLALPAARAFARSSFKGKSLLEALFYAPLLIPPFVPLMGMHMTLIRLHITDSALAVIAAHIAPSFPYMLRGLLISYRTLGVQWEEQAQMLGAGRWQRWKEVVLPHLLPGIAAGCSLSMLVSLSQYLTTFLAGGGRVMTLPLLLFPFASGGDLPIGSAYALLFAGIALLALVFMDRLLKRYYWRISAGREEKVSE